MTYAEIVERERQDHLEMWRHYDTLRQAKNTGFMMANSIMVAITGILFKEPGAVVLVVLVSFLSILVCMCWFLLLCRNAAYIKFHRKQAGKGDENYWMPESWTPRSNLLTLAPLMAFFSFWMVVLSLSLSKIIPYIYDC